MIVYTPRMPRPGSQSDRILRALADGRWHTVNYIHRHAGPSRLNSRVSDLRRLGWAIQCERIPGERRGSLAYRYRCLNPPTVLPPAVTAAVPAVAYDPDHPYRLYLLEFGERRCIASIPDRDSIGTTLETLADDGELAGECVGLYRATDGKWILNPWDAQVTT